MKSNTLHLVRAAVIAALYVALTLLLQPLSFGYGGFVQLRLAEILTVLPIVMPEAIPGLTVGCFLANLLGGGTALDIALGPIATLLAALVMRKMRNKPYIALAMPAVFNGLIVGFVLQQLVGYPYWMAVCMVVPGELIACYAGGPALLALLKKTKFLSRSEKGK